MDRESVSTFRNSSSEAGNSSFSVWKLEFLSVETEVYNCGNAKELKKGMDNEIDLSNEALYRAQKELASYVELANAIREGVNGVD